MYRLAGRKGVGGEARLRAAQREMAGVKIRRLEGITISNCPCKSNERDCSRMFINTISHLCAMQRREERWEEGPMGTIGGVIRKNPFPLFK